MCSGNLHSRVHQKYKPNQDAFWDWSIDVSFSSAPVLISVVSCVSLSVCLSDRSLMRVRCIGTCFGCCRHAQICQVRCPSLSLLCVEVPVKSNEDLVIHGPLIRRRSTDLSLSLSLLYVSLRDSVSLTSSLFLLRVVSCWAPRSPTSVTHKV